MRYFTCNMQILCECTYNSSDEVALIFAKTVLDYLEELSFRNHEGNPTLGELREIPGTTEVAAWKVSIQSLICFLPTVKTEFHRSGEKSVHNCGFAVVSVLTISYSRGVITELCAIYRIFTPLLFLPLTKYY